MQPVVTPGPQPLERSGHEIGFTVAKALEVPGSDAAALKQLRALSADDIFKKLAESGMSTPWRSIFVDGHMFPRQMCELISMNSGNSVDLIVGSTRNEGTAWFPYIEEVPLEDWEAAVKENLDSEVAEQVIAVYNDDAATSTRSANQEMMADVYFA